jgi:hypothetical protein
VVARQSYSQATATSVPTSTARLYQSSQRFLAIVGPEDAQRSSFAALLGAGLLETSTSLHVAELVAPWADSIRRANFDVAAVEWPPKAADDMKVWLLAGVTLKADLQNVVFLPAAELPSWFDKERADAPAEATAENLIRTDLDLPPEPLDGSSPS